MPTEPPVDVQAGCKILFPDLSAHISVPPQHYIHKNLRSDHSRRLQRLMQAQTTLDNPSSIVSWDLVFLQSELEVPHHHYRTAEHNQVVQHRTHPAWGCTLHQAVPEIWLQSANKVWPRHFWQGELHLRDDGERGRGLSDLRIQVRLPSRWDSLWRDRPFRPPISPRGHNWLLDRLCERLFQ